MSISIAFIVSRQKTQLTPLAAEPESPAAGMVVLADRVNWDPLSLGSGGAYQTMYLGAVSGWGTVTAQLD